MWGFHDHALSMRKALNETLITSKPNNSLYRRWRWAQSLQNKKVQKNKMTNLTFFFLLSMILFFLNKNGMKNGQIYYDYHQLNHVFFKENYLNQIFLLKSIIKNIQN
jgi:hypothetical protein